MSQNLARISDRRVLNNTIMGDHFPIICKLGVEVDIANREIMQVEIQNSRSEYF